MYGLDGTRMLPESTLSHLAGYRGSVPVRIGNGAYTQYQAGVVGVWMVALAALRERCREVGRDDGLAIGTRTIGGVDRHDIGTRSNAGASVPRFVSSASGCVAA